MQYDQDKYQLLTHNSPQLLFWAVNPLLAFNELILGQRLPQKILVERHSGQALLARQFVPCPHCNALNPAKLWGKGNAFGHWFGYICPKCSGEIPCLWNLTSLLLLTITVPLWLCFKPWFKQRWQLISLRRTKAMQAIPQPQPAVTPCIKTAQTVAVLMFLFMLFVQSREASLSLEQTVVSLAVSCFLGVLYGLLTPINRFRKSKKRYW
ncbi:hypothetical protein [Shewanella kaireitica]|uniref:hypothetical protein n=1 Tax=Shewanella kaireitica TaxID=212021 RepID=UPI00200DE36F|nr:hypothetical protein [Shewanella kaireitica]MCL1094038.1 hypothetical protein [Shewanella kaireitica]